MAILDLVATTDSLTRELTQEYQLLTETCGLLDRSSRGKLALTGSDAAEFLNGQVTNDVAALTPGEGCYAAFLTHKGKMLGDLRVLRPESPDGSGAEELLLDTERLSLQALFDLIRRFKVGYQVELHKRTLERGLLSLIGPRAGDVAAAATGSPSAVGLAEDANRSAAIDGTTVLLIGTDLGVDVICESARGQEVASALIASGAQPVSEAAAEIVRVEGGRPRYGADLDDSVIPQEAGLLDRAVSFTKGCYVGQETVARLYYRGKPNRHLRGLRLDGPAPTGEELRLGERAVGRLASSVVSPRLGAIGLALVRREAGPSDRLVVGADGVGATLVSLPFER